MVGRVTGADHYVATALQRLRRHTPMQSAAAALSDGFDANANKQHLFASHGITG